MQFTVFWDVIPRSRGNLLFLSGFRFAEERGGMLHDLEPKIHNGSFSSNASRMRN
jgi:hypothetical protein